MKIPIPNLLLSANTDSFAISHLASDGGASTIATLAATSDDLNMQIHRERCSI